MMEEYIFLLKEISKTIEEAMVNVPYEWVNHKTGSGIPYAYTQGVLAGRAQALEIIRNKIIDDCAPHLYGDSTGRCLKCGFDK